MVRQNPPTGTRSSAQPLGSTVESAVAHEANGVSLPAHLTSFCPVGIPLARVGLTDRPLLWQVRHTPPSARAARPSAVSSPTSAHRQRLGLVQFPKRSRLTDARSRHRLRWLSVRWRPASRPLPTTATIYAHRRTARCGTTAPGQGANAPIQCVISLVSHRTWVPTPVRCIFSTARSACAPSDLSFCVASIVISQHNCGTNSFNQFAVLPNPSFNLTRSGLRPPRAS